MAIGWSFPLNNDGSEDGLNHPGIETFLSKPLESLAREVIQNTRDAAQDSTKPVIVHFDLYDVPRELFPGVKEFEKILDASATYWNENSKTKKFFANAKTLLNQPHIRFLKISDYNTKGLAGAQEKRGTDWYKLTKSVGASDKGGGQDGSFGIGKHAPFACSAFRTVFYGTKVEEDKTTAFQGVAKLVTHLDKSSNTTQGTGYYGEKKGLNPILALDKLDQFFARRRYGTDIYIPGFTYGDDWKELVALSVIKNFFVSINDGQLIVNVGDIRIDSTSLPQLMDDLVAPRDASGTCGFYNALVDENAHIFFEEDFMGMGRIELQIAIDENLPKQVAMVRRSGMLVYVKKRFRTPLRFSAVFIARGEELNSFLKSLEPPAHDDWEPQRHQEDEAYAKRVLQNIHSWITDKIKELSAVSTAEEIDPEGIGQFLPDELDENDGMNTTGESQDGEAHPRDVEMQTRTVTPSAHQPADAKDGGGDEEDGANQDDYDGPDDGTRTGRDTDNTPGGNSGDETGGAQPGLGATTGIALSKVNLQRFRLFCINSASGEYILSYIPDIDGTGTIRLNVVGEVGNDPAPIALAKDGVSGAELLVPSEGTIGPITFIAGQRKELLITLKNHLRCAMEVAAYAN